VIATPIGWGLRRHSTENPKFQSVVYSPDQISSHGSGGNFGLVSTYEKCSISAIRPLTGVKQTQYAPP